MKYKLILILFILLIVFSSCKEDVINITRSGAGILHYSGATFSLTYTATTWGTLTINTNGFIRCENIAVSFHGFRKNFYFTGNVHLDSSITLDIVPLDSAANSKLKLEAQHSMGNTVGTLYYCDNINNNCNYAEIGQVFGFYSDRYEGFYYSPLFNGSYKVNPY